MQYVRLMGAAASAARSVTIGLVMLAAVWGAPVFGQPTTLTWPSGAGTPNVDNYPLGNFPEGAHDPWMPYGAFFSASYYQGKVYLLSSYIDGTNQDSPVNHLDLMSCDVSNTNGTLSNLTYVGPAFFNGTNNDKYTVTCQPASCVFNGLLYYFWTATAPSWNVVYGTYNGNTFSSNQANPVGSLTAYNYNNQSQSAYLAAAVCDNQMIVFCQSQLNGQNVIAYSTSADGENWSAPATVDTLSADLWAMSAASFYNSATGQMNVMLATAVTNYPTSVNLYTWDGTNISKLGPFTLSNLNASSDATTSWGISGLALQNGTVSGGTTTSDAMQLFVQYETPHSGLDDPNNGEISYGAVCYVQQYEIPLSNPSNLAGLNYIGQLQAPFMSTPPWGYSYANWVGVCPVTVGSYDSSASSMQQYINLVAMTSVWQQSSAISDTQQYFTPFSYAIASDKLVYDPTQNGLYDITSGIGSDSEANAQFAPALVPMGYIAGLPPFTYNGNASSAVGTLSSLSLGDTDTTSISNTTDWSGSASVTLSGKIGGVGLGLTGTYNLEQSLAATNTFSVNHTISWQAPNSLDSINDNGDYGFFIYQAPTLVNNVYRRYPCGAETTDTANAIQPNFNYTYVSHASMNSFAFQLANPSVTIPPGFGFLTQGITPLWSSTDLSSWTTNRGTVLQQILANKYFQGDTINPDGFATDSVNLSWTQEVDDDSSHGYALKVTADVGTELLGLSTELDGSLTFNTSNSTTSCQTATLTGSLPAIPSPAPASPTYEQYSATPFWVLPTAQDTTSWVPTNCQGYSNFFCLTYLVNATPSSATLSTPSVPVNQGQATATNDSSPSPADLLKNAAGNEYTLSASAGPNSEFDSWSVSRGSAVISYPDSPSTSARLLGDAFVTANFRGQDSCTLTMKARWEGGAPPDHFGSLSPAWGSTTTFLFNSHADVKATVDKKYYAKGYRFLRWELSGPGKIRQPYAASTWVGLYGDATLTAVFGRNPVSLTIASDNAGFCWASPEGRLLVEKGGTVHLDAFTSRPEGLAFHRWSVKSGKVSFDDAAKGRATVKVPRDATIRAEWLRGDLTAGQLAKMTVALGAGGAKLQNIPLTIGKDALRGKPSATVDIGGTLFKLGVPKLAGAGFMTYAKGGTILVLDLQRGLWSFTTPKNIMADIVASHGVCVSLKVGGKEMGYALPLQETATWHTLKDSSIPGLISAKGSVETKSSSGALFFKVSTKKGGAVLDAQDPLVIVVGEQVVHIPVRSFNIKDGTRTYEFKSKADEMVVKIDAGNNTLSLNFSGWHREDFDIFKGIPVDISCGAWRKSFTLKADGSIVLNRKLVK